MKRKMQRIEALQQNLRFQKDTNFTSTSTNLAPNNQSLKRENSNILNKKKKDNSDDDLSDTNMNQKNVFTEKHFTPNKNFVNYIKDHKHKKGIVITARVHPGESNASFIAEGIITFLLGNSREAVFLRNNFIIKILPMINPDGVIYGNYRWSLLGVDLNRRWNNPSKILHPTIYNAKQLIKMLDIERSVSFFCDIHGHSRKKNVFMYGWYQSNIDHNSCKINDMIKLMPYMLSEKNKIFSFKDCTFAMEKEKENTARIVIFSELGIVNWYTLEATFFGSDSLGKVVQQDDHSDSESSRHETEPVNSCLPEGEANYSDPEGQSKKHMHVSSEPNEKVADLRPESDENSKDA